MEQSARLTMMFLALAVVLPMVPAYGLFKFLPSTGDVSGPLKGLNVKFGGAFGGYLVVFLALLAVRPADFNHYHLWTVTGRIEFVHKDNEPPPNVRDVVVRIRPPHLDVLNQGKFNFEIPVFEDAQGSLVFPDLQLDIASFEGVSVPLSRYSDNPYGEPGIPRTHKDDLRVITIDDPVMLKSKSLQRYDDANAQVVQPTGTTSR